jgi:hypothetical protein
LGVALSAGGDDVGRGVAVDVTDRDLVVRRDSRRTRTKLPISADKPNASPRPRRLAWAALLARVFALDITVCRKCGGRMRVLEVVSDPDDIARVLHGALAPPRPPTTSARRARSTQSHQVTRAARVLLPRGEARQVVLA